MPAAFFASDDAEVAKVRQLVADETDGAKKIAIITMAISNRLTKADAAELAAYRIMLGDANVKLGKVAEAQRAYQEALPWIRSQPPQARVEHLNQIGRNLYEAADRVYSAGYLRIAVESAREGNLGRDLAQFEFNLSNVTPFDAEKDVACLRSVENARKAGLHSMAGDALGEVAYRAYEKGNYSKCIFYFEKALAMPEWKEADMRNGAERLIVGAAGFNGDWRRAQKYGPAVEQRYRNAGRSDDAALVINDIAYADFESNRYAQAIAGFQRAFKETTATATRQRALIRYNEGMALQLSGKPAEAIPVYTETIALAKKAEDWGRVANCESSLGMALLLQKKPKLALPYLLSAAKAIPDLEDPGFAVVTLQNLEKCHLALGQTKAAKEAANRLDDYILELIGNDEVMRIALGGGMSDGNRQNTSYFNTLAASEALRKGRIPAALNYAERAKARTLVDLEGRTPIDPKLLDAYQAGAHQWLRDRVRRLQTSETGTQVELGFALDELIAYEAYLRTTITDRKSSGTLARAKDRATLESKASDLSSMPRDTVFMEIFQSGSLKQEEVAIVLAWSEKGKAKFHSFIVSEKGKPLTIKAVEDLCVDFGRVCASPSGSEVARGSAVSVVNEDHTATRLSASIYAPMKTTLARFKRIVVSPDAATWRLPLEALPIGNGQRVIDRWEVSYAYSLTQWLQTRGRPPVKSDAAPFVVANPTFGAVPETGLAATRAGALTPLPGTAREAELIRRAYPKTQVLTGSAATSDAIRARMAEPGILHFATHGLFDPINPLASSLACAKELGGTFATELFAEEIRSTPLKARLAVLSACETGRGEFRAGEGPIGLTFAFLKAGCPVVVSSRWSVSDATTAELMGDFYAGLAKGKPVGTALRAAILKTKTKHPQPYYWAPFMAIGDAGR